MTEEQVKGVYATAGVCLEFDWDFGGSSSSAATISISDSVTEALATVHDGERAVTGATFIGVQNSYATLGIATIFGGSVTIEIVFKLKELDCGINCDIDTALFNCGRSDDGIDSTSDNIVLSISPDGLLKWGVSAPGTTSAVQVSSGNAIVTGVRYHVVATVSVSDDVMAVHVNGQEIFRATPTAPAPANVRAVIRDKCYIGRSVDATTGTTNNINGEVSSFKLYSGAMAQADVVAAYEANFPFLECDWDFRGATSSSIVDSIRGIGATHADGDSSERTATGIVLYDASSIDLNLAGLGMYGGAVTIEMTAKFAAFNENSRLIECLTNDNTDKFSVFNDGTTGRIAWTVQQGSGAARKALSNAPSALVLNAWSHIVATVTGDHMTTYLNGVKKGEQINGWTPNPVARAACTVGTKFSGEVAALRLHSGAMSQLQVTAAYKDASRAKLFLQHWWDFRPAAITTSCAVMEWDTHRLCCPTGMVPYGDQSLCAKQPPDGTRECALYVLISFVCSFFNFVCSSILLFGNRLASHRYLSPLLPRCTANHPVVDSIGGVPAYLTQTGGRGGTQKERHTLGALPTATGAWLDGANDFIDVLLSDEIVGGAVTIEVVVTFAALASPFLHIFECIDRDDGGVFMLLVNYAVEGAAENSSHFEVDEQYHIIATVNESGVVRHFVNGKKVAQNFQSGKPKLMTRSSCYIGKSEWITDGYFTGVVSSVKMYSGSMSDAISSAAYADYLVDFNVTLPRGPRFAWDFGDAAARDMETKTIVIDSIRGATAHLRQGAEWTASGVVLDGVDDYIELRSVSLCRLLDLLFLFAHLFCIAFVGYIRAQHRGARSAPRRADLDRRGRRVYRIP
jgi:hypothetical protein